MMELLRLYYDVKIMLNIEDKTVAVSIEPNFKAPKHTKKEFKKLVEQGEMKKYVKGNCDVENLYVKKQQQRLLNKWKRKEKVLIRMLSKCGFAGLS